MNQGVSAGHFGRLQHDRVSRGPSQRTTPFDRVASPIGSFQPGTFLWKHAHAEECYQSRSATQSAFPPKSFFASREDQQKARWASGVGVTGFVLDSAYQRVYEGLCRQVAPHVPQGSEQIERKIGQLLARSSLAT